jgi:protein involved in polysaccharide export with SLBB domain
MRTFAIAVALVFALLLPVSAQDARPVAVVHAGDRLQVQVNGESEVSQTVFVADDGTIGLPLVGQIHVAGATPSAVGQTIAAALKRYVRDPKVVVSVLSEGHINVLVLGVVANSGEYQLRSGARLSDAIAAAGGMDPTINGEYPIARIAMPNGTINHISLDKLLRGGDPDRDIVLPDHAAVYVPGATTFDITVLGAVDHPGTITLNEGDRLSIAIAKAGNSANSKADLNRIVVTRTEAGGKTASHPVDLYQSLEKGDTRFDPRLSKGDIVYVPVARQSHGNLTNAIFLLTRLFLLPIGL